jgi:hypothetical protein
MSELLNAKNWTSTVKGSFEWSSLSDDQLLAVYKIATGGYNFFGLYGKAGSGKTRTTMFAKSVLEALGWEVRVCGTTGVASVNVRGEGTINKLFALGLGNVLPTGLADLDPRGYNIRDNTSKSAIKIKVNSFAGSNSKRPLAIFIDELSMSSSENLYLCYCIIKEAYPNRQILLVGVADWRQLLAVPSKDTRWEMFTSLPFEDALFKPKGGELYTFPSVLKNTDNWKVFHMSLVTNHRQKTAQGWFVEALNALGDGKDFNHSDIAGLQSRVWYNKNEKYVSLRGGKELPVLEDAVHFYNTNAQVLQRNKEVLDAAKADGHEHRTYKAQIRAFAKNWDIDKIAKEVSPIEAITELAVGLDFMVRQNLNENLANGTVGKIVKLEKNKIKIRLDDGSEHWVEETDINLPVGDNGNPVGQFIGLPGHLSHALTPWKGQGLTIRKPVVYHIDRKNRFHGLVYMIATRVETPDNLYIVCEDMSLLNWAVYCDPRVKEFIKFTEQVTYNLLGEVEKSEPQTQSIEEHSMKRAKLFDFEYIQEDRSETAVAHILKLANSMFVVCYEAGEVTSAMYDSKAGEFDWDRPVDASVLREADLFIREEGYDVASIATAVEVVEEVEVNNSEEEVISSEAELPMWAIDPTNSNNIVINNHSVPVWKGEAINWVEKKNNDVRTIYAFDVVDSEGKDYGGYGVYIKDPAAFGSLLISDQETFEFFKQNVKYVWFEEIDTTTTIQTVEVVNNLPAEAATEEKPNVPVSAIRYYAGVGSRETPKEILCYMRKIGFELAKRGYILRSGGADGADTAFEDGAKEAKGEREIFRASLFAKCNSTVAVVPSNMPEARRQAKEVVGHWNNCKDWVQDLHARNVCQILGDDFATPVEYVICWTPGAQTMGGTATAIKLAEKHNIPVINLANKEDFDWLVDQLGIQLNVEVPVNNSAPVIKLKTVNNSTTAPVNNNVKVVINKVSSNVSDFNSDEHDLFKVPAIAGVTMAKAAMEYAVELWADIAEQGAMYQLLKPVAEKAARGEKVLITCAPGNETWVEELIDAITDMARGLVK